MAVAGRVRLPRTQCLARHSLSVKIADTVRTTAQTATVTTVNGCNDTVAAFRRVPFTHLTLIPRKRQEQLVSLRQRLLKMIPTTRPTMRTQTTFTTIIGTTLSTLKKPKTTTTNTIEGENTRQRETMLESKCQSMYDKEKRTGQHQPKNRGVPKWTQGS